MIKNKFTLAGLIISLFSIFTFLYLLIQYKLKISPDDTIFKEIIFTSFFSTGFIVSPVLLIIGLFKDKNRKVAKLALPFIIVIIIYIISLAQLSIFILKKFDIMHYRSLLFYLLIFAAVIIIKIIINKKQDTL